MQIDPEMTGVLVEANERLETKAMRDFVSTEGRLVEY